MQGNSLFYGNGNDQHSGDSAASCALVIPANCLARNRRFSTPLLSNPVNSDFLDLEYILAIN